ncbi:MULTISPECIES: acyl-CoA dehydrogenase family protein [Rhodococcus]|uniref:acyl-CoA dehydrogenase family protein n=1 Tax=Rhodococcus globerulus TaxID=33008 RepID=UPI001C59B4DC|nr:acyl-CoA dehydrogenase [Rhodococcus globerulus]QXV99919.1 acyl-CoA dehydrogenase [Rhodococcus globerulus]
MSVDQDVQPFELPARYRDLQQEARELAKVVAPIADRADESATVDAEVRALLTESELARVVVPARFGGRDEAVDSLAVTVVREALAYECAHLDSLFAMQGIGSFGLSTCGNVELQQEWLPKVASMEAIAALALTEPQVGSDLKAMTTSVKPEGDMLVVNGHKSFITNGGAAGFYSVLAKEGDGYSLVLVPADAEGVRVETPFQIIAPHILGDIVFDNVRVPEGNRISAPGEGFGLVLNTLATFRVSVAGAAVGLAQAALDEAVRHTSSREQFGVSLARLGPIPSFLAQSWVDVEMSRTFAYRAAAAAARDPKANLHLSSIAKAGATEAAGRVVDRSVQMMGRFGLVRGSKIERLYREARPMRIYEGSTEVIFDSLAKKLVRDGVK